MTTPAIAHPGNDYYVNIVTHTIQRVGNPLLGRALIAAGFTGPYTYAQAKTAASAEAATGNPAIPGSLPAGIGPNLGGVAAIGDFFNRLTEKNTWIRVGEVIAGLILVYIGINALLRDTAAGSAIQSAKKTADKVAVATGAVIPK